MVSALVPVLVALVPLMLAVVLVVALGAAVALYVVTGETIDMEIPAPAEGALALAAVALLSLGAAGVVASLAAGYSLLIVLPTCVVVELICARLAIRRALPRLGAFAGAGVLLGGGDAGGYRGDPPALARRGSPLGARGAGLLAGWDWRGQRDSVGAGADGDTGGQRRAAPLASRQVRVLRGSRS